jgi:enamine deaminase RidA (YjgF/YER057c/UK114 family)
LSGKPTGAGTTARQRAALSARADGPDAAEIWIAARPEPGATGFTDQLRSAGAALFRELEAQGAAPSHLVAERIFYSDISTQAVAAMPVLAGIHRAAGLAGPPVLTHVEQPPAEPGRLVEIQAWAMAPGRRGAPRARPLAGLPATMGGASIDAGGVRRILLTGITGGEPGDGMEFTPQADRMFARAEALLRGAGLTFRRVARTWIFLDDIDRDYAALNHVRHSFFDVHGVQPVPASTGIRGGPHPADRLCAMDLVAYDATPRAAFKPIHAPTMNEAPSYGSDFSRGMRVDLPDRAVLYISGTASIDTAGQVVHPGDPAAQAARMLTNVRELLEGQGAGLANVVSAVTYLKSADDRGALLDACRRAGLADHVPHTVCVADVCRPEWLCEMEAIAVLAG